MISLAVPGSASFAGEFLILAGAFQRALVVGRDRRRRDRARGDVHAAADLRRAARGARLDRERRGARPASRRARARRAARRRAARAVGVAGRDLAPLVRRRRAGAAGARRSSSDPHAARRLVRDLDDPRAARRVVRRAARRGARARAARGARSRRASRRSASPAVSSRRSGSTSTSASGHLVVSGAFYRDRWTMLSQIILCGIGLATTLVGAEQVARPRDEHISEFFSLLLASTAGMAFFVGSANLMVMFLALEWFSIALYVMCAIDYDVEGSLEAGLKYLIIGSFGSAALLFGSALVYGATGRIGFARDRVSRRRAGPRHDAHARARPRDDHRRARLQVVGGAVPHVDARRLRGRADDGDGVHVGGDEGRGVRARLPRAADGVPAGALPLGAGRSPASRSRRSRSGTSRRSCSGT